MRTGGPEVVDFKVLAFPLEDVKLQDGPYMHATELDVATLLGYEPDRFLSKFRKEAGLEPKAENYEGWEGGGLAGHSLGHYLTALTFMYKTTGNEEFLKRANYFVDELAVCQEANGTGYVGAERVRPSRMSGFAVCVSATEHNRTAAMRESLDQRNTFV